MAGPYKSDIVTTNAAAKLAQSSGLVNGDDLTGDMRIAQPSYTLLGTEATGEYIELFRLPPGAVIIPQNSSVQCSADPGTTLTLDIGDTGSSAQPGFDAVVSDEDRYADGIVLSAGGLVGFCSTGVPVGAVTPFRPKVENLIRAKVDSANTLTAGVKLTFTIVYRIKG